MMFIHAVTGCDTTSRILGVGKKAGGKCTYSLTTMRYKTLSMKVISASSTPEHLPTTESATKFHCRREPDPDPSTSGWEQKMVWMP